MSSGSMKYFVVRLINREYERRILFHKQANNFLGIFLDLILKKGFGYMEDKICSIYVIVVVVVVVRKSVVIYSNLCLAKHLWEAINIFLN